MSFKYYLRLSGVGRGLFSLVNSYKPLRKQTIFQTKINVLNRNSPKPFRLKKYSTYKCWNCEYSSEKFCFKCPNCQKIQNPDRRCTFFEMLGQEVMYDLEEEELKRMYKKLQTEFHPDKFSQGSDKEMSISANISAIVNRAYYTLSDPYERGMYMLSLQNVEVLESDIQLDKAFLMEVMERNEELESLAGSQQLEQFDEDNNKHIREIGSNISMAFASKDYSMAKAELQRMKYYVSIRSRLKEIKTKAFL